MRNSEDTKLPRRAFLQGAATILGASVLGTGSALARTAMVLSPSRAFRVWFWNGEEFVLADSLPSGDSQLERVQITVQGFGSGSIRSIDVHSIVPSRKSSTSPFLAWTSAPNGIWRSRFAMSVKESHGLLMTVTQADKTRTDLQLKLAAGGGVKLREGAYVLAPSEESLAGLTYAEASKDAPIATAAGNPAKFAFILMTIEQA